MPSSGPDRTLRRALPQPAVPGGQPASRATWLKLLAFSLVLGLMLVSLDFTPATVLHAIDDIGPSLQWFGNTLWRAAEVFAACLLAGGLIVVPAWLIQRYRWRRATTVTNAPTTKALVLARAPVAAPDASLPPPATAKLP